MNRDTSFSTLQALRCSLFFLLLGLSMVLWAPVVLASRPFPRARRYHLARVWLRFHAWILRWIVGLRFTVQGLEHLPPGPAVVLCKHQSMLETFLLPLILPPQTWVLKRELLRIPLFGPCMALMEPIAIDREQPRTALKEVLVQGQDRLRQGLWVVVYPEGTRVAPGASRPYNKGGAWLAQRAGVPVVPIAIDTGLFWPGASWRIRPGTIHLVIGPSIETDGRDADAINDEARDWIETTSRRLAGFSAEMHAQGTAQKDDVNRVN
ncbi:MAG TPA: lysophospholipid acyltransferase family protein [Candidatus Macondimonas sp.]|nr:lysophospholipid acyltransferase family protein [Candidatus Macondimonas sp.]